MTQRRAQQDTIIDYEAVVVCESNGQWLLALGPIDEFAQDRVQPIIFTDNAVASAWEKGGQHVTNANIGAFVRCE